MALYCTLAAALLFLLFLIVYHRNKTTLWNGFLFLLFLFPAALAYLFLVVESNIPALSLPLIALALLVGFLLVFGIYIIIGFLLFNAHSVAQRERRSLGNSLTLLLALLLIAAMVSGPLLMVLDAPYWLMAIWLGLIAVGSVYLCVLAIFLLTLWLANMARPRKNQQYIIVLGSGLIDGEVPPLLAGRIDKAIRFYEKQKKRRFAPTLIFSGGQGADEPRSEAAAMQEYAIAHGVAEEDTLLEDSSTTTAENMRFSKQLIDFRENGKPARCIYATSNYHLLRAGRIARAAGMKISGLGGRTAFYYLPSAILREFIAVLWMDKKRAALLAAAIFSITTGTLLLFR